MLSKPESIFNVSAKMFKQSVCHYKVTFNLIITPISRKKIIEVAHSKNKKY